MELLSNNLACMAIVENPLTIRVISDDTAGLQSELWIQLGKVFQHVVGAAAVRALLADDERKRVLVGVGVDQFDVVDDPVAGGEDACAWL